MGIINYVSKWGNSVATYMNLFATMVIGGLWHGASWNFLLWGALNGLGLMAFKFTRHYLPWSKIEKWWARAIGVILTFNFITFTRIWFRSGSGTGWDTVPGDHNILTEWFTANDLLYQLYNHFNDISILELTKGYYMVLIVMALGYITHLCPERISKNVIDKFTSLNTMVIWDYRRNSSNLMESRRISTSTFYLLSVLIAELFNFCFNTLVCVTTFVV